MQKMVRTINKLYVVDIILKRDWLLYCKANQTEYDNRVECVCLDYD